MMAWKRIFIHKAVGATMLGFFFIPPALAQVTISDIRAARQQYLQEFLRCSDMSQLVNEYLATTPGTGWDGYHPTEWYIAADLARAMGCGHNTSRVQERLRQALDYAEGLPPFQNKPRNMDNWYEIEIGVPRALAQGLLLGGQSVPSDLRSRMQNAMANFIRQQKPDETEGANVIWWAWTKLLAAFYLEDVALAEAARKMMVTATSQGGWSHIQEDWGYAFHHRVLNMHYGGKHYGDFVTYLKSTENTRFSLESSVNPNDEHQRTGLKICLEWLKHFLWWTYYKDGLADPYTASKFPHQQGAYGGRIKWATELLGKTSYAEVKSYRAIMQSIASGSANPIGARAFPQARYLVARRNNFFASLMMVNLVEPHMEASSFAPIFGAVNIVDPSSFSKWNEANLLKHPELLLNAMTLPVAYENATVEPGEGYSGREHEYEIKNMLRNWGYYGVSTLAGYYGMGAEQLTGQNSDFSFRRSWFFLEDELVCMGSGLTTNNSSLRGLKTSLYSFASNGGSFQSSQGGNSVPTAAGSEVDLGRLAWLHHEGMGYFFPEATNVRAQGLGAVSRVYLNHGNAPAEVNFVAALLPTFGQNQTQNYAANPGFEVLQCDRTAHIVRHKNSNVTGIAAFEPLDARALTTNLAGYVLYQSASGKFSLSLYNPFREEKLSNNTVDDRVNPMFDASIRPEQATYRSYKLQVPFRLRKGAGPGMDLFTLNEVSSARSELQVYLRVYRKFELAGTTNPDGSVTIDKAWIAWNDAASEEATAPPPTNLPPIAIPGGPYINRVGEAAAFNGSSSYDPDGGSIVKHEWSFGDGATATGAKVSHVYAAVGAYAARLEVTDDEGDKNQVDFVVTIQPQPSPGENLRVLVSGDDKYALYINGVRLGENASWQTAEEYAVPLLEGKNVIAVKAENWDQAGAFLAEVYAAGKFWPSNAKWKVSLADENGWQQIDFNDDNWSAATSHGLHGIAQPWAQFQNVSGISTDKGVHWIWSADKRQDHVVYLRFTLPRNEDTQAPASPTGVRISTQ
jgi:hypothetical protein